VRIGLLQYESRVGDIDHNLRRLVDAIGRLAGRTDLVVTPELYLGGYQARDSHHALAQSLDGPAVATLQEACARHEVTAVVGMARRGDVRGLVHNSAVVVPPRGEPTAYDKVHLPNFSVFEEGLFFAPGRAPLVVPTPAGRIGLAICYDFFFPELTKRLALAGADCIIGLSASPAPSKPYFETVLPARALETTTGVVFVNLVGAQDHLVFWGGSCAIDPLGGVQARLPYYEEAEQIVALDADALALARKKRPTLRDTRLRALE